MESIRLENVSQLDLFDDNDRIDWGLHKNSKVNDKNIKNAFTSEHIQHLEFVLMAKILFGDNLNKQNDEELFDVFSLKIRKMIIKEGELFTRSC